AREGVVDALGLRGRVGELLPLERADRRLRSAQIEADLSGELLNLRALQQLAHTRALRVGVCSRLLQRLGDRRGRGGMGAVTSGRLREYQLRDEDAKQKRSRDRERAHASNASSPDCSQQQLLSLAHR